MIVEECIGVVRAMLMNHCDIRVVGLRPAVRGMAMMLMIDESLLRGVARCR
jgi:hypothetical protein